jgi:uncharacterized RDD family membrane protein YckC
MAKEAQLDRDPVNAAEDDRAKRFGSELEKKYPIALAMYAVLIVVSWLTVGPGHFWIRNRPVDVRWIPTVILALFAFRTYVAMQADRIRRGKD